MLGSETCEQNLGMVSLLLIFKLQGSSLSAPAFLTLPAYLIPTAPLDVLPQG